MKLVEPARRGRLLSARFTVPSELGRLSRGTDVMDSYEFNKIAGAILTALLVTTAIGFMGNALIHPIKLEKPAYIVAGVEEKQEAAPAGAAPAAVEPVAPLLASANADAGKAI